MDDLISRKAAIDAFEDTTFTKNEIRRRLSELPSAELKRGKWEMKPDPFGFFDEIPVCSECGCTTEMRGKTKYCPNCGADMRGESE